MSVPQRGAAYRHAWECFSSYIRESGIEPLLCRGVLLAFSGGADSVLLFSLLQDYTKERHLPFAAAHVHHGIRGETAERDAAFCRDTAQAAGVPFFLCRVDTPAFAAEEGKGQGLEGAARTLRYRALDGLLTAHPIYGVCATAHHATDNLETLLLHLLRGSGIRGMCGIPPIRGAYVRPLLSLSRAEILAAVEEEGLPYVTDETNGTDDYARNYLRHEVLPRISRIQASPEAAANRLCENLREDAAFLDRLAEQTCAEMVRGETVSRAALLALPHPLAVRVLGRMYLACGGTGMPERAHFLSCLRFLSSETVRGTYPLPGGVSVERYRDTVTVSVAGNDSAVTYDFPLKMGENHLGNGGGTLWLLHEEPAEFEKRTGIVYNLSIQAKVDSATISGRLAVRTRHAGDVYRYGNMTRTVRRLLAGRHLPPRARAAWPIVYDERGIVWVPGFGVRDESTAESGNPLFLYFCRGGDR